MSDLKQLSIDFLIQCYFGSVEDPILASIDRAYIDMQTHTLSGKREALFAGRKIGTEIIYSAISGLHEGDCFDEWHKKLAEDIKEKYSEATAKVGEQIELTYGQIQKWINMTVKYCFVLKQLGAERVSVYFDPKNVEEFHAPLDSYVLQEIQKTEVPWSKIAEYEKYDEIRKEIGFLDELKNWPRWADNAKLNKDGQEYKGDIGTYKRYIQDETAKGKGYSFKKVNR